MESFQKTILFLRLNGSALVAWLEAVVGALVLFGWDLTPDQITGLFVVFGATLGVIISIEKSFKEALAQWAVAEARELLPAGYKLQEDE